MTINAAREERTTLGDDIASVNEHMERLAEAGEWTEVSELLAKRNAMLRDLDDDVREDALRAAAKSTDQVRRLATKAQGEVGDKLAQLKRGRQATDSYRTFA